MGIKKPYSSPTVTIIGAVNDAITMYVAVVGSPMPRSMLAMAVIRRRRKILPPEMFSTIWVIIPPMPIFTTPTIMPAAAQASATDIMFFEPWIIPLAMSPAEEAIACLTPSAFLSSWYIITPVSTSIALKAESSGECLSTTSS